MKTKMRPRYYCDHCPKGTGSASFMRRHERGCTANPARVCGFCGRNGDVQDLATILVTPQLAVSLNPWEGRMVALREATDNCPACILAAIRQSGVQKIDGPEHPSAGGEYRDPWDGMSWPNSISKSHVMLGFDWKAERDRWNAEHSNDDGNHY